MSFDNVPPRFLEPLCNVRNWNRIILFTASSSHSLGICPHLTQQDVCAIYRPILRIDDAAKHEVFPCVSPFRVAMMIVPNMWLLHVSPSQDAQRMGHFVQKALRKVEIMTIAVAQRACGVPIFVPIII